MKTIILILLSAPCYAQPFIQAGIGNTVNGGSGYLINGRYELAVNYQHPFSRADIPSQTSITAGYEFSVFTASIGGAYLASKDIDKGLTVKEFKPIYGLEIGKDAGMGRYYISAQYCKRVTWGVGIRFWFD